MKKNASNNLPLPVYSNVSSNITSQSSNPTATDNVHCNTANGFRSNATAKTPPKQGENEACHKIR